MAAAAVALAALGVVGTPSGATAATGTGAVAGSVSDEDGPIAGVVVQLYEITTSTYAKAGRTDAEGEYRISSLAPGAYKAVFRDPSGAHVTAYDGSGDVVGNAMPPVVRRGETVTIDRQMVSVSTLGGVVTDGDTALGGMKVALYREGAAVRVLFTGADGSWSAAGLEPGAFTVGYSDPARVFVPEYHGDAPRRADAAAIVVEPGTCTDVEAELTRR